MTHPPAPKPSPGAFILGIISMLLGFGGILGTIFDDRITGVFAHVAIITMSVFLVFFGAFCLRLKRHEPPTPRRD